MKTGIIKPGKIIYVIFTYLLRFGWLYILIIPMWFTLTGAFKVNESLATIPYKWLPQEPSLENFRKLIFEFSILNYLKNSVIVTVISVALQSFVSAMAGYGFGRMKFPGRDKLFLASSLVMMVPFSALMIPLFIEMKVLGWVGNFLPLIVPPALTYAYGVFIFRQFIKGIPHEYEESAYIDGCGSFQIFLRIILPLVKPAYISVVILGSLGFWNDYQAPLIFLNEQSMYTAQLALGFFRSRFVSNYTMSLAAVVVTVIPILMIFLFLQKYFIASFTHSGVKG